MSTEVTHRRLSASDLKAWDTKVQRALCELVNTYGVEYRLDKNQMHLYLYAPGVTDETITKFKASRSRSPEQTLKYLEKWAVQYIRPAVAEESAAVLAAKFNDPTKVKHEKAVSAPQPTKEAPVAAQPVEVPQNPSSSAPVGYHVHLIKDQESNWWARNDGTGFLCRSCDYTVDGSLLGKGPHQEIHTRTTEFRAERSRKATESKDDEYQGKRAKARNAIKFLAEEYDITFRTATDNTKVARLEAQVTRLETERDDLRAQLALIREVMKG